MIKKAERMVRLALAGGLQNRKNFFRELSPFVDERDQGQPWLTNLRAEAIRKHEDLLDKDE